MGLFCVDHIHHVVTSFMCAFFLNKTKNHQSNRQSIYPYPSINRSSPHQNAHGDARGSREEGFTCHLVPSPHYIRPAASIPTFPPHLEDYDAPVHYPDSVSPISSPGAYRPGYPTPPPPPPPPLPPVRPPGAAARNAPPRTDSDARPTRAAWRPRPRRAIVVSAWVRSVRAGRCCGDGGVGWLGGGYL